MSRYAKIAVLASTLVVVPIAPAASTSPIPGRWRVLPAAPAAVLPGTSVWTGMRLFVFGNVPFRRETVAETYDPVSDAWSRFTPPTSSRAEPGYTAVWTGTKILVWSAFHSVAFSPATRRWQALRQGLPGGIIVWSGREAIGWGGGCCGDATAAGRAYDPARRTFRALPRSPLAPSQRPLGAWTGHELLIFVSSFGPDGRAWPARFARAAAYNPTTNAWRRIAPLPSAGPRFAGSAVWDGREVLVVGADARSRSAYAYSPRSDRWRHLASLPAGRVGASAVWSGRRLFLFGGQSADGSRNLPGGLSYDPRADRWSELPHAPLQARSGSAVAWTGHELIVWGGEIGTPAGTHIAPKFLRDGAAFTPATQ
jgi:hypothetical protein